VVVPARNEERSIAACLDSILAQDERDLQVLVVDGASTDRTAGIVLDYIERDPRVELLYNPQRIIPIALNIALAAARGTYLVRVDAHARIPPTYVSRALKHLRTARWGGVGGRKDGMGGGPAGRAVAAAMASRFGVGNSTYHYGEHARPVEHIPFGAYPVALARELGGWDESLRVNQDFEFDYRVRQAGHELLFDPELVIHWENRQSVGDLFRQYRRYGRGKLKVVLKHPRSLRARHLAAPGLVTTLGVAAAIAARRPVAASAMVLPYVVGLGIASSRTVGNVDPPARPYVAPAFLAMHTGWGLGFLEAAAAAALTRRQARGGR
jgi:succinoglycan biosynthesis protein ExoA